MLQELVCDISQQIIGMQPTITYTSDINGVSRSHINWEIPTVHPFPPNDAYFPQWDHAISHLANVAFIAKVFTEVPEAVVS